MPHFSSTPDMPVSIAAAVVRVIEATALATVANDPAAAVKLALLASELRQVIQ